MNVETVKVKNVKVGQRVRLEKNHWAVIDGSALEGTVVKIVFVDREGDMFGTTPVGRYTAGLYLSGDKYGPDELTLVDNRSLRTFYVNTSKHTIQKYPTPSWLGMHKVRARTLEEAYQIMEKREWSAI